MDVTNIITKSRIQTNTSIWQKSDVLMLQDLNIVYKEIFSRLSTKSKKHTRQTYKTSTVVWQSEYNIPKPAVADTGLKRVLNIQVKYSSDWEYKTCKIYDTSVAIDSEATDTNNPYCIQRDDSIFLYPAPTEAITDWLIIDWQYMPLDLTLATTSSWIKLASEYHDLLVIGLNMWTFGDKQLFDKQWVQKVAFEEGMIRLVEEWWADIESWYETSPSEIIYESDKFLP